jgi:hypothetical protein
MKAPIPGQLQWLDMPNPPLKLTPPAPEAPPDLPGQRLIDFGPATRRSDRTGGPHCPYDEPTGLPQSHPPA